MPSTYTLNNGIELIGTGEQSGTWGDTTNTNFELVDTALDGQVTITLAAAGTSGSPNDLPVSDGTASNGRNRLIIFNDGGDLGATAYVQLTPNDAEKIIYVRNDLSGSRSIILFQGTYNASNDYEVPAGTTAVIYFDGAGTGAVAANVFNNAYFDSLRLGDVSVSAILDEDDMASDSATALATQQSIKAYVDTQVGANNELSEVLANGNTSGGTNIQMSTTDELQFRDTAIKISSSTDGKMDIDADLEVEIVAPTVDIDASTAMTIDTASLEITGAVDMNTSLNVDGDITSDGLTVDGDATFGDNNKAIFGTGSDLQIYHDGSNSVIHDSGTGDLTIRGTNLKLQPAAGTEDFLTATTNAEVTLYHNNNPKLTTTSTGVDVTGTVTADGLTVEGNGSVLTLDNGTNPATVTNLNGNITTDFDTTNNGRNYTIQANSINAFRIANGGDISFYEDTGTTPKFFWDASAEKLELGSIQGGADGLLAVKTNADNHAIAIEEASGVEAYAIGVESSGSLGFYNSGSTTASVIFDDSGNVGIGVNPPSHLLHVAKNGETSIRFGEGGDGDSTVLAIGKGFNADSRIDFIRGSDVDASIECTTSENLNITYSGANTSSNLNFINNTTTVARLDSSGRLLVGKTAFSNSVDGFVFSVEGVDGAVQRVTRANNTGSQSHLRFYTYGGSSVGSITTSTTATSYNTSSDYRLKEDWQPMTGASERVLALNPVNFAWKSDGSRVDGFLAHEAQAVVPEAVHGEKDAVDEEGNPVYQGIDQSKLVPLLTAALQEALNKIDDLETRIAALEAK